MGNSEPRYKVPGPRLHYLEQVLNQNRFNRLGYVLPMPTERCSCCKLYYEADNGWKMVLGGQSMTWAESIKSRRCCCTTGLCIKDH